ncbi:hypothetical protein Tco_0901643 [Tanacetum coccineum]
MRFRSPGFEYQSQPPQHNNMFYQNRPFLHPYNNQNAFYQSPTGLYRPTMDSSASSQANEPYALLNRLTHDMDFEQLINIDDDDSPVEEMSLVKAKKPSKRASRTKKNDGKEIEAPKDWTKAEEIALWQDYEYKGARKIQDFRNHLQSASGGFNLNNEADEYEEEAREHQPMGRDASKAKKKSHASSREGSSSFVALVVDKYLGIKSTNWEKIQEQQDSYIQLKNQELDIHEAAHKEATDLKREKLEIHRRKLQLYKKKETRQRHFIL